MPTTPHIERHFTAGEMVRDIVIGMADGLTVPFALAAGLSGAVVATRVIVTAGVAEISAGAIAMGLGGNTAARSDVEHCANERRREEQETQAVPELESQEITGLFEGYGIAPEESAPVVTALRRNQQAWVNFMMRFELGLELPDPKRAVKSALTIGVAYIVGGLIPLLPHLLLGKVAVALRVSVLVTLLALLIFGFVKSRFTGAAPLRNALQTLAVGGLAATTAFLIARAVG